MQQDNHGADLLKLRSFANQNILRLSVLKPVDLLFAIDRTSGKPVHVTIVATHTETGAFREIHQVENRSFTDLHENDVVPEGLLVLRCSRTDQASKARLLRAALV